MRATSAGSLTRRSRSTRPSVGTSSWPSSTRANSRCWAHVTPWASRPTRAPDAERGGERLALLRDGGADLDAGVDARRGELLARLGAVAAVGVNTSASAVTSSIGRAPGEAGEVAHVREVGDEQRVDAGVGERGRARVGARAATSIAGSASSATRGHASGSELGDGALDREAVPGAPKPAMVPVM